MRGLRLGPKSPHLCFIWINDRLVVLRTVDLASFLPVIGPLFSPLSKKFKNQRIHVPSFIKIAYVTSRPELTYWHPEIQTSRDPTSINELATFFVGKFKFIFIFLLIVLHEEVCTCSSSFTIGSYGDFLLAILMDLYHELSEDPILGQINEPTTDN